MSENWVQRLGTDREAQAIIQGLKASGFIIDLRTDRVIANRGEFYLYFHDRRQLIYSVKDISDRSTSNTDTEKYSNIDSKQTNARPDHGESQARTSLEREAEIQRLREWGKPAIKPREDWERRALVTEALSQELESDINRLRERGKLAVKQRDEWERRALAAEARAMELARSASQAEGLEKMVRQEIFKQLWPKVEEITNGRKSR